MSRLLVVVKSHLFPQFIQLNREIGVTGEIGEFGAVNRGWVGTALGSYLGWWQSSPSRRTGNPSEARWRRQLLITLTHNRYFVEAPG